MEDGDWDAGRLSGSNDLADKAIEALADPLATEGTEYQRAQSDSVYYYAQTTPIAAAYAAHMEGADHWDVPADDAFVAGWKAALAWARAEVEAQRFG